MCPCAHRLTRCAAKAGCRRARDGSRKAPQVERRRACAFSKRKGAPWSQGRGSLKFEAPSRRSAPLAFLRGRKKGLRRARAAKNRASGALAFLRHGRDELSHEEQSAAVAVHKCERRCVISLMQVSRAPACMGSACPSSRRLRQRTFRTASHCSIGRSRS